MSHIHLNGDAWAALAILAVLLLVLFTPRRGSK